MRVLRQSLSLRICFIALVDCAIVAVSASLPLLLRFGIFDVWDVYLSRMLQFLPIDMAIAIVVLALFKLYKRVWTYAGVAELTASFKASLVIEAVYIAYKLFFNIDMPRSFYVFEWIILFLLLGSSRLSVRLYRQVLKSNHPSGKLRRTMVVGAGSAASILIAELKNNQASRLRICCIVDDNPVKKNKLISGIRIEGDRYDIPTLAAQYGIEEIIIAMPSAPAEDVHEIILLASKTDARVRILSNYAHQTKATLSGSVRDINYEDLLSRNAIDINNDALKSFLDGKTVLVTGGGGSIGSRTVPADCREQASPAGGIGYL